MEILPTDTGDFAGLFSEHSGIINKVCFFYATDKVSYEDLRQEIYVNLWLDLLYL